jgi:GrpB-like predicted nucleotidyltransferase (UPF0157 family)
MKPVHSMKTASGDAPYLVQYHPYDPRLPDVFAKVKDLVQAAAGPVSVEHVGSSSIPGLGGRNALDIAVPATKAQQTGVKSKLYEIGFEDSPFPHFLPLLVGEIIHEGTSYQILLYVVSPDSTVLADWLKFRDHMRTHPEDAQAYAAVKQEAIAKGKSEGDDYQEAKNPFLLDLSAKLKLRHEV